MTGHMIGRGKEIGTIGIRNMISMIDMIGMTGNIETGTGRGTGKGMTTNMIVLTVKG